MIFEQLDFEICQGNCKLKLVVYLLLDLAVSVASNPTLRRKTCIKAEPCLSLILYGQ